MTGYPHITPQGTVLSGFPPQGTAGFPYTTPQGFPPQLEAGMLLHSASKGFSQRQQETGALPYTSQGMAMFPQPLEAGAILSSPSKGFAQQREGVVTLQHGYSPWMSTAVPGVSWFPGASLTPRPQHQEALHHMTSWPVGMSPAPQSLGHQTGEHISSSQHSTGSALTASSTPLHTPSRGQSQQDQGIPQSLGVAVGTPVQTPTQNTPLWQAPMLQTQIVGSPIPTPHGTPVAELSGQHPLFNQHPTLRAQSGQIPGLGSASLSTAASGVPTGQLPSSAHTSSKENHSSRRMANQLPHSSPSSQHDSSGQSLSTALSSGQPPSHLETHSSPSSWHGSSGQSLSTAQPSSYLATPVLTSSLSNQAPPSTPPPHSSTTFPLAPPDESLIARRPASIALSTHSQPHLTTPESSSVSLMSHCTTSSGREGVGSEGFLPHGGKMKQKEKPKLTL
jgi:hypothetical protein